VKQGNRPRPVAPRRAAMHLVFDTSYNSRSQQAFARYRAEKEVQ